MNYIQLVLKNDQEIDELFADDKESINESDNLIEGNENIKTEFLLQSEIQNTKVTQSINNEEEEKTNESDENLKLKHQ